MARRSEISLSQRRNETWGAEAKWEGYAGDWKNISFNRTVILINETYNLKLITGSYPQIHHTKSIKTESEMIKCKEFKGCEWN